MGNALFQINHRIECGTRAYIRIERNQCMIHPNRHCSFLPHSYLSNDERGEQRGNSAAAPAAKACSTAVLLYTLLFLLPPPLREGGGGGREAGEAGETVREIDRLEWRGVRRNSAPFLAWTRPLSFLPFWSPPPPSFLIFLPSHLFPFPSILPLLQS